MSFYSNVSSTPTPVTAKDNVHGTLKQANVQKMYRIFTLFKCKSREIWASICGTTSEQFSFALSSSAVEEHHTAVPLPKVDSQVYIYRPG